MAGPENIKAGFMKERDIFAEHGIRYTSPFVSMAEPEVVPKQIYDCMKDVLDLDLPETQRAVEAGYRELRAFNQKMRDESTKILTCSPPAAKPSSLRLVPPSHMPPR